MTDADIAMYLCGIVAGHEDSVDDADLWQFRKYLGDEEEAPATASADNEDPF